VKNQVHLQEENFQLMEALNTMGQLTNMQSRSGPIAGTGQVATATSTTEATVTVFEPDAGTSWAIDGVQSGAFYTGQSIIELYLYDGSTSVEIGAQDGANTAFTETYISSEVRVVHPMKLTAKFFGSGSGGTGAVYVALHRVR
jgi:hypothetical protein